MMNSANLQNISLSHEKDGDYSLSGKLSFDTISSLLDCSDRLFNNTPQGQMITIDCAKLNHIDSAGIALFLEWKRKARHRKQEIQFKSLPKQAKAIIKAAHLDDILGEV